jgi:DNA-directed RNA polymerase specialized sigma24 family protein
VNNWASVVTTRLPTRVDRVDRFDRRQHGASNFSDPKRLLGWLDHDALEVTDVWTRLPARDHTVLVLRDLQGLSEHEVAETLGLPVGTVKSRVHRARRRFREEWSR